MQTSLITLTLFSLCFVFCKNTPETNHVEHGEIAIQQKQPAKPVQILQPENTTVASRFNPPDGFERIGFPSGSYQSYLQNLPLQPAGAPVLLFNGDKKYRQNVHAAVIDLDIGTRDLQQCADAIMRLRAEHFYAQGEFEKIHFNFTNGFNATYAKWRSGYRIKVAGNNVSWVPSSSDPMSYASFRQYLNMVFSYAGTWSLEQELQRVPLAEMQIGDVFIQGGSPGHAVVVIDMAENKSTGRKVFMIAQSYMPAQHIHVLINPEDSALSPWYDLDFSGKLFTPEWTFEKGNLMRFEN